MGSSLIPPAAPDPAGAAAPPPPAPERTLALLVGGVLLFVSLALAIHKWFPDAMDLYHQMVTLVGAFAGALLLRMNSK